MTALDFPNSPTVGQTFAPGGAALSYMWDGTRWRIAGGLGSPSGCVGYTAAYANIGLTAGNLADVVSVTFNQVAGRRYQLSGKVFATMATTGQQVAHIRTAAGAIVGQAVNQLSNVNGFTLMPIAVIDAATNGSVTYKLTMLQVAAGTIWADSTDPAFLLVEDITYQPGGGGGTVAPSTTPAVMVGMQTGQDALNNTATKLAWQVRYWGPASMWSGAGISPLTAPLTGMYLAQAQVRVGSGQTAGDSILWITANGGPNNWARASVSNASGTARHISCSAPIPLSMGGYIECWVYQSSGATLHVDGDNTLGACSNFSLTYIGPSPST